MFCRALIRPLRYCTSYPTVPETNTIFIITTVVMRCLGIPCRSVTNFESAHDAQGNCTDDHYLDENWDEISSLSSDSIW